MCWSFGRAGRRALPGISLSLCAASRSMPKRLGSSFSPSSSACRCMWRGDESRRPTPKLRRSADASLTLRKVFDCSEALAGAQESRRLRRHLRVAELAVMSGEDDAVATDEDAGRQSHGTKCGPVLLI